MFTDLRGGQTFYVDQQHLDAFDRACSVNGPFYALKDTVFSGSFTGKTSSMAIRARVAKVLLELISCGLWTLGFGGVQSMAALSPSLLPSLTWLRSRPVTRASADAVSADMSVDSLEEGDSIASSPLGALRATRGSVTSDELEFLPLSVQSNPAPSLPPLFRYLDSASNASLIALLERTLNRVSDLTVTRNLSCKEVCSEWRALGVFFAVDGRDLGGRRVANAHLALNLDRADFDALKEHQSSKFTN